MDEETRWFSYDEMAEIRRISRESAARIARLKRWPKRTGNDGTIRVAVPLNFLEGKRRAQTEHPPEIPPEIHPEMARIIKALEGQIGAKDGQIEALKGQIGAKDGQIEALKGQIDAKKAQNDALREDRDRWHAQAEQLGQALTRKRKRWWPFRKRRQREEAAKPES